MAKILFIVLDGAADVGKATPLHTARKPSLDDLARHSQCGMWHGAKVPPGYNVRSLSELALLELLGYSIAESPGRGVLEALGAGLKPKAGAVYFRANFATVRGKRIADRRAGKDLTGLEALAKLLNMTVGGFRFRFYRSLGHRGILEVSGKGAKPALGDSDVGTNIAPVKALAKGAEKTAAAVNEWLSRTQAILSKHPVNKKRKKPANYILLRGAGSPKKVEPFAKRWRMSAACVSADGLTKGLAHYLGMRVFEVRGATGRPDTNLKGKLDAVWKAFAKHDFVLLHIKGTDVASHAKDPRAKRACIERLDKEVFSHLTGHHRALHIVVTADHITSSRTGEHMLGPVPFLLYVPEAEVSEVKGFDEVCCSALVIDRPMERLLLEIKGRAHGKETIWGGEE